MKEVKKEKLVPELRFPEFKGEWESNKLGNIAEFDKGKNISKTDISEDGKIECIRYGELYTRYKEIIEEVYSKTNLDKEKLVFSEKGDVLTPSSGETAIDIATVSCINKKDVALGGDINIIKSDINGNFLAYYLSNKKRTDVARLAQGISVIHLYKSHLKSLSVNLPSKQEQQKIASFLSLIDKKIELLKKKEELLELYKKGVMQKIFNREIRFKDKNGNDYPEWEEKRLGEIGKFHTSSVDKKTRNDEKGVYLVNYMDVYKHKDIRLNNRDILMKVSAKDSQIRTNNLLAGDMLFTPSSETPEDIGHSIVIYEDLPNTLYSYHLLRFRPSSKMDLSYQHYFCNHPKVLRQIIKKASGATRFTVSLRDFSGIIVSLPSYLEQKKIGKFLVNIDEKISELNNFTELMNVFKKGLLQKMFI